MTHVHCYTSTGMTDRLVGTLAAGPALAASRNLPSRSKGSGQVAGTITIGRGSVWGAGY